MVRSLEKTRKMKNKEFQRGVIYSWDPLLSPAGLIQDAYYPDRWKVAVVCILLNRTRGPQVLSIIDDFFKFCSSPQDFLLADETKVKSIIGRIGFKNTRYKRIREFSEDFLSKKWKFLSDCRGIGEYADACDRMYFLGEFGKDPPKDHALVRLWHHVVEGNFTS